MSTCLLKRNKKLLTKKMPEAGIIFSRKREREREKTESFLPFFPYKVFIIKKISLKSHRSNIFFKIV